MKKIIFLIFLFLSTMVDCSCDAAGASVLVGNSPLDLQAAQRIALANNPTLAVAAERITEARQRIKQVRALYYPKLDLTGITSWSRISENSSILRGDRDVEYSKVSLIASWQVFDGFSRKFQALIAEYSAGQSELARRDGQRLLLQSVAEAYYNCHFALSRRRIAGADSSFNRQELERAEILYKQGSGSLSNVLNFKVQINRAKRDVLLADRDYAAALDSLMVLLGLGDEEIEKGVRLARLEMVGKDKFLAYDLKYLIKTALQLRPDYNASRMELDRRKAVIGRARAPFYPQLSLRASFAGEHPDDWYVEGDDFGTTVALSLSYNLYHGGADKASLLESKAAWRGSQKKLLAAENRIRGEVRTAYTNLQSARQQLVLQKASTELVTKTRDLVKSGYEGGQESLVRLNGAQRDLVRTRSDLALSLVGLYRCRTRLKAATGEILLP